VRWSANAFQRPNYESHDAGYRTFKCAGSESTAIARAPVHARL